MMPMLNTVSPKASTSRKRPERRTFTPSVKYGAQQDAVARKEAPINAKAIATLNLITATREAVARLSSPTESPRTALSLALTLTSLDHGASAAQLIGLNASVHGVSIATLFRAQLETFVRAVFFGSPSGATDYEVEQFISQDKLPRRPERENRKDKAESTYKRKRLDEMTFAMFGDFAAAILDPRNPNGPAMAQMLKFAKHPGPGARRFHSVPHVQADRRPDCRGERQDLFGTAAPFGGAGHVFPEARSDAAWYCPAAQGR
jgi:hypothetical protein